MNLADIPLFSMLRSRMGYLSEKERVIGQNVANSDTPRYQPSDLKAFTFDAKLQQSMPVVQAATQANHIKPPSSQTRAGGAFKSIRTRDSETTLDGNSVVLEEQMMKMTEARMNYDAAIGFYQKSLAMLRMAAKAPGR
jgi:flagellar basal-body rod protein FlgB